MEVSNELFVQSLRAGLWGDTPIADIDETVARDIWTEARKQSCRGVVGQVLLDSGILPPKAKKIVSDRIVSIIGHNLALSRVLSISVKALRDKGIEPVLLKGQGAASSYPQPLLRECGDIDLYVGTEHYREAFDVLSGLTGEIDEEGFSTEGKHSHVVIDGMTVETHRFSEVLPPGYDKQYQELSDMGMSSGGEVLDIGGTDVRIPEPTFNAFYLFNHLWRHFFTEGVGFRQVCDWTMFLHARKDRIDKDRLGHILKTLDLTAPWKVFGNIAVGVLGLPADEMPFYSQEYLDKSRKIVRMMLKEGNFGHERREWYALDRNSVFGLSKVMASITGRYLGLYPVFGRVILVEYIDRIRRRLSR